MTAPSLRPAIFVLLALAFSAPTLLAVATGTTTALSAGEHLVASVLVSWAAVGIVGRLIDSYRVSVLRREERHHRHRPHSAP
ncbi:MAG TPA: hypothetical protein VFN61_13115 [Acidimicrobiales bacterium]|nr:hypothetical protein [Acidimicrobiales bacterium]